MPYTSAMVSPKSIQRRGLLRLAGALACAAIASCANEADAPNPDPSVPSVPAIVEGQELDYTANNIVVTPKTGFARALSADEIGSVLVIGDSISEGRGTDGYVYPESGRYLFSDWEGDYYEPDAKNGSWVNRLRAYCMAAGVSEFLNASIAGSSYSWLLEVFDDWVGEGADAIVVMLGTNDATSYDEEALRANVELALTWLAARCAHLLVIAPPNNDRNDLPTTIDIAAVDTVIHEVCAENGHEFVSAYWALEPHTADYNDDQVHPTTAGALRLWDYLAAEIGLGAR